jgi:hypothetical protein
MMQERLECSSLVRLLRAKDTGEDVAHAGELGKDVLDRGSPGMRMLAVDGRCRKVVVPADEDLVGIKVCEGDDKNGGSVPVSRRSSFY